MNLRAIADTFRINHSLPVLEQHAAILAFALVHPLTGAPVAYINSAGVLISPAGSFTNAQIVTTSTPTTGGTVNFASSKADEVLNLTPAGTLAALTVTFPTNTNSRIGQRLSIVSTQIVTALTVSSSGLTIRGTAITSLAANTPVSWIKVAASTWQRLADFGIASGQSLVSPVITTGLTASGSAANDYSASTGTFLTSTGANTLSGTTTLAANKNFLCATGTTLFDFSLGTGIFSTTTGLNTINGPLALAPSTRSGPGAVPITKTVCKLTTTGVADALTLANGVDGQVLVILHDVDGGSAVLTPTTKTGFTTITFTNVGETCTLEYATTRGWFIRSLFGAVAA